MKKVVSSGLATHKMDAASRTFASLPVRGKAILAMPEFEIQQRVQCFMSACRPMCLLPTSTKTSFPPLKARRNLRVAQLSLARKRHLLQVFINV